MIHVKEELIKNVVQEGMDAFIEVFVNAIYEYIGGELNAETMNKLNTDQITLLAYHTLRDEVMDGGFVQLIHNGYGAFIFKNPFGKAIREWGIDELATLINKGRSYYQKYGQAIEAECTEDEFMALFEKFSDFDDLDDKFVENEEEWTSMVAHYIDEHIEAFAEVEKD